MKSFKTYIEEMVYSEIQDSRISKMADEILSYKEMTENSPFYFHWSYLNKPEMMDAIKLYLDNTPYKQEMTIAHRIKQETDFYNIKIYIYNKDSIRHNKDVLDWDWEIWMAYPESIIARIYNKKSDYDYVESWMEKDLQYFLETAPAVWKEWSRIYFMENRTPKETRYIPNELIPYFEIANGLLEAKNNPSTVLDIMLKYGLSRSDWLKLKLRFGLIRPNEIKPNDVGYLF